MGTSLEIAQNYRAAINAYKASLELVEAKTVRAALNDLQARQGFRVVNHTIDADSATARACVQFSEPLVKMGTDYTPFVTLNGVPAKALKPRVVRSAPKV